MMMSRTMIRGAAAAAALAWAAAAPAAVDAPAVTRSGGELVVSWRDADPADVYVADRADAPVAAAKLLSRADRDGKAALADDGAMRRYFLIRDGGDGAVTRVAERLLPLAHGSNFRDIGGYPAAGGKHVRWGMIYRSGATPLLTDADVAAVKAAGVRTLVDLRSTEERAIAPTRLAGLDYNAVDYSMTTITQRLASAPPAEAGPMIYRDFPTLLAPQLRILFATLLAGEGPVAYNCSAGQDRTGLATALILTALGVPREAILADYHLSTQYRRPEYEMPHIDTAAQANNPVAMFFARHQDDPAARTPKPLYDAHHRPFLLASFEAIEAKWVSVDAYLAKEIGVDATKIGLLRAMYLE